MNTGGIPILTRVTIGNLISVASTIIGAAMTVGAIWGLLGYRVAQLEVAVANIPTTYARQSEVLAEKTSAIDLRNAITSNTRQVSELMAALAGMSATMSALKDSTVDLKNRLERQEEKTK